MTLDWRLPIPALPDVLGTEFDTEKRMTVLTYEDVKGNAAIRTYIQRADESLTALGFTEHSFAHVTKVARFAKELLLELGYGSRKAELAWIAGYLHDIGNVINRIDHAQSGAVMAFRILDKLGMSADEIATVCSAIGNHDESTAFPVNAVAAALILADKTDVRRTRVRNRDKASFDIHDRGKLCGGKGGHYAKCAGKGRGAYPDAGYRDERRDGLF